MSMKTPVQPEFKEIKSKIEKLSLDELTIKLAPAIDSIFDLLPTILEDPALKGVRSRLEELTGKKIYVRIEGINDESLGLTLEAAKPPEWIKFSIGEELGIPGIRVRFRDLLDRIIGPAIETGHLNLMVHMMAYNFILVGTKELADWLGLMREFAILPEGKINEIKEKISNEIKEKIVSELFGSSA